MAGRLPKSLKEVEILPNIRVGIVLEGGIPLIGILIAEIEDERVKTTTWSNGHCTPTKIDVDVDVDEEPKFILVQLLVAAVFGALTFPIGSIVAVNVDEILVIGPSPI